MISQVNVHLRICGEDGEPHSASVAGTPGSWVGGLEGVTATLRWDKRSWDEGDEGDGLSLLQATSCLRPLLEGLHERSQNSGFCADLPTFFSKSPRPFFCARCFRNTGTRPTLAKPRRWRHHHPRRCPGPPKQVKTNTQSHTSTEPNAHARLPAPVPSF